jgi:SAM-dependent methyltransferase
VAAESQFDDYAEDYEGALDQGLSVSGEGKDFFARGRIEFLGQCLRQLDFVPRKAMDFGCGTGASAPSIRELTGATAILGVDTSARSIERANAAHAGPGISFSTVDGYAPTGDFDLVYTNGVFHHIPPAERPKAFAFLRDSLRPGGLLALWENNPWSPGARYVMSRIPFDRDAIMISARSAARLARAHGFRLLRTDYLFIFPAALKVLRPLEGLVRRIPAGAQYQVLCEKL